MNYYLDTEFLEGTQKKRFLGIPYGETKPTIDLISIGIVAEDDREYYAISKDFNLEEAWNRYDWKQKKVSDGIPGAYKEYWIRKNVLKPVWVDLKKNQNISDRDLKFTYKSLKKLLNKYGKSNKQIAEEIKEFTKGYPDEIIPGIIIDNNIQFYAYYADYDWVAFCWLFGKMIDLPKGFPMYCIDLKQILDETADSLSSYELSKLAHGNEVNHNVFSTYDTGVLKCSKTDLLKHALNYPKQENEHNSLADARWNKKLHKFLKTI